MHDSRPLAGNLAVTHLRRTALSPSPSYHPPAPLRFGYDPERDLPPVHLARLVEQVVEATVARQKSAPGTGQPPYDPRLCIKVLLYGYATGLRSSRRLEQ